MIRLNHLFVLAGVFQVITSQGPQRGPPGGPPGGRGPPGFENIPEQCRGPPKGVENPDQCCQVESIYTEDDLASCGFTKGEDKGSEDRREFDCSKPLCLLKQKGLVNQNEINHSDVAEYLTNWAGEGDFKAASKMATEVCLKDGKVPGPPQICEAARLMHCIGSVIFSNCPETRWLKTDSCKALKDHMEQCKAFF